MRAPCDPGVHSQDVAGYFAGAVVHSPPPVRSQGVEVSVES
jgi:hypothetical protein